ncbi:butyrophilin subfamily 3 member A2-like [Myripristis murdjan]|uniref:butyrophilin subfamily 3 member A2-like n=1 Tax=Myripristis murdjan TaxID=586833 RepID=UPI00117617C9|nr:butyrophilin subfamily 3 member A2-like [Myripristis murdjan]
MLYLKDGLSLKSRLTVLVFHHTVAALLLTHTCAGESQLIGPTQPIVAMIGHDVILPCHLDPAEDATAMTVEWARPDLEPRFVHVLRDGLELDEKKYHLYMGRTSLLNNQLKHGDVSLKLATVKLSDEGKYKCFIPTLSKETFIDLVVGAASSPVLTINKDTSAVVLDCESKGWHPKPELFWLDAEGKLLSAGAPETVRGPDGLYTVSNSVAVEKSHSNSYTCRVQQHKIQQTRETQIHLEDGVFIDKSNCSAAHITTGFAIVLLCVVVVVFFVYLWRTNKLGNTKMGPLRNIFSKKGEQEMQQREELNNLGHESLTEEERERQKLMREKEVKKNAKLEEEQKKENERKQREELEKQIKQLESQVEQIKKSGEAEKKLKEDAEKMKHEYKELLKKTNLVLMNRRTELEMRLKRTKEKNMTKKEEKVKAVIDALKETKMMIDEVQKKF